MEKLKPCPFCGGDATIRLGSMSDGKEHTPVWRINCQICNASMTFFKEFYWGINGITCEQAISAWNRRTSDEND